MDLPPGTRLICRNYNLPTPAFAVLKELQRLWGVKTNAEVLTRLLLSAGRQQVAEARNPLPFSPRLPQA